jgi:hypothetical protein
LKEIVQEEGSLIEPVVAPIKSFRISNCEMSLFLQDVVVRDGIIWILAKTANKDFYLISFSTDPNYHI